ncbi:MAG: YkgJ family cysteine cluster protein [Deltaproteobacteria bacterium]|nr:YkgJ family cysteine cluster protein [Deltaproteobacteria bacterium]
MIDAEDLHIALRSAKLQFYELQSRYDDLPPTQCLCQNPGVCCVYLPQMTLMEALQWIDVLRHLPDSEKIGTLKLFMRFYLTNPVQPSGCPFLKQNACGIYKFRPFACRAYGLWSRHIGDHRTDRSRQERKSLFEQWKRLGLKLPPAKVEFEIDYCNQVECIPRKAVSDEQLIAILEKIYQLDQSLPEHQKKFEEEYHSDFSFLMTSLVLGIRKSILVKFVVIKEIVNQGSSKRLLNMLARVTPDVLGG